MWFKKASPRRQAIREDVAEAEVQTEETRGPRRHLALVAGLFFVVACLIQFWPGEPLAYREGERAPVDIRSPATFRMVDPEQTERNREAARATAPPVLVVNQQAIDQIRSQLSGLKHNLQGVKSMAELPPEVVARFPGLTKAGVEALLGTDGESYESQVRSFMTRGLGNVPLVAEGEMGAVMQKRVGYVRLAVGEWSSSVPDSQVFAVKTTEVNASGGLVEERAREMLRRMAGEVFPRALVEPITNYVMALREPTMKYDAAQTAAYTELVARQIMPGGPEIKENDLLVRRGELITPQTYRALQEAETAFRQQQAKAHPWSGWLSHLGQAMVVLIITGAGAIYVSRLSGTARTPRQAWVVCAVLLAALAVAKAAVGMFPTALYLGGLLPTMVATIMLVIAYNQRFALGVGALHGLLVTMTLGQGIDFYLPLLAGVGVFSLGLGEIRTLGKLLEVGGLASAGVFASVFAMGLLTMKGGSGGASMGLWGAPADMAWVSAQSLWGVTSGVLAAIAALALLRPVERTFNITTAMRLLEYCDANKALLRRLSQEAPGTFNHSLTVGIMAEAAANAIGANGLLCRVGSYYHDVGKLSKPQYFIENQTAGGPNRHDKLSPAMSLLIIVGHVKDGIELAREYQLPAVVHPFIGQHHGTTLVEYFYHAAKKRAERSEDGVEVSDTEFRYPGPKPQTRETAIVMICDGCESVVRAIDEPTAGRIESAVHNMIMKRLMDGQFSECELTLKDLGVIEETLVRTLAAIHHGRVAYPSATIGGGEQTEAKLA